MVGTLLSTGSAQSASLRELMERMGHSSTRAALIYLHATRERDQAIAAGMGKLLSDARKTGRRPKSIGHATGTRPEKRVLEAREKTADHASDLHWDHESGRPGSNRHDQLGRSVPRHLADLREYRCWSAGRECP